MTKPISIIVAIAQNNAIGLNNDLLCHVPGDLKRFKEITTGHTIVMGRKTYESLPRKPLPNRKNVVISRNVNLKYDGCVMVQTLEQALSELDPVNENFIIGGAEIYKMFLPLSNKLYITHIHKLFEADVFFPEIDTTEWKIIENKNQNPDNVDFKFTYATYIRNCIKK